MSYELNDFTEDVLQASNDTPVVIDFWAEWCGPCRQLGPVLEKLAGEAKGRWKLVKIDTDEHQEIASHMGIRGIPAVKMVYQKQIIAEFTGAQPEHQVRKWLKENLPGNGLDDEEEGLNQVKILLGKGQRDEARTLLERTVSKDSPDEVKALFAMLHLPDRIEKAGNWLKQIEENEKFEIEFQALETVRRLASISEGGETPGEGNKEAIDLYLEGATALIKKNFEEAIQKFIQSLQIDRTPDDDGARKACIACFAMLGEQHPLSVQYRRRFSMALY